METFYKERDINDYCENLFKKTKEKRGETEDNPWFWFSGKEVLDYVLNETIIDDEEIERDDWARFYFKQINEILPETRKYYNIPQYVAGEKELIDFINKHYAF